MTQETPRAGALLRQGPPPPLPEFLPPEKRKRVPPQRRGSSSCLIVVLLVLLFLVALLGSGMFILLPGLGRDYRATELALDETQAALVQSAHDLCQTATALTKLKEGLDATATQNSLAIFATQTAQTNVSARQSTQVALDYQGTVQALNASATRNAADYQATAQTLDNEATVTAQASP